jgi:hypothetical protein
MPALRDTLAAALEIWPQTTVQTERTGMRWAWSEVRPSRLSGVRKIVDAIFSFSNRNTDVTEKYFVRVDVTEEFPFLVSKLSSYYDR